MIDAVDRATASIEMDDAERETDLGRRRREHEAVIARMAAEAPEARNCVDCGAAIGLQRLQAEPEAVRCLWCQEQIETRG